MFLRYQQRSETPNWASNYFILRPASDESAWLTINIPESTEAYEILHGHH